MTIVRYSPLLSISSMNMQARVLQRVRYPIGNVQQCLVMGKKYGCTVKINKFGRTMDNNKNLVLFDFQEKTDQSLINP